MKRRLKNKFYYLDVIQEHLSTNTMYKCSIVQDEWFTNGEMVKIRGKKCVLVRKNNIYGAKVEILGDQIVEINPVIPSRFVNTLTQRGLLAILIRMLISPGQKQVAIEVGNCLMQLEG